MEDRDCLGAAQCGEATHLLAVYAMPGCPGWNRAQALASLLQAADIADLEVRIVDLSRDRGAPECVVASPTWVLDGRRLAFGNPDADWLLARLSALTGGD
jgi:hypothetical protein